MGNKVGYAVNVISCVYIIVFVVIYCFPYSMPVAAVSMNYSCLIAGGISMFAGIWWYFGSDKYIGPQTIVHEGDVETSVTSAVEKSQL